MQKENGELYFLPNLTSREQGIFNMLINGTAPKEIAYSLNITFNTFKTHQKNLYRKLGVNTIVELITKYQLSKQEDSIEQPPAVFTKWNINKDNLGSSVEMTEKNEHITDMSFSTITISGKILPIKGSYAGIHGIPHPVTLEAMKKVKSFSFKVLGDGNSYLVSLPTTDTRLKGGMNHYRKMFATKNSEISTVYVSIDELVQSSYFGTPVPFITNNIEFFQIHAYSTIEFNLKFWDINFYS